MELALIKEIKEFGLDAVVEKYHLLAKDYDRKVLVKYSQIDSPMGESAVQDARGIILEKATWKVMSMGFRKFFNSAETHAAKIDWINARILEKCDGTYICCYFDWHKSEWCTSTTGTAEGEGEVNNKYGTTFADLFWSTIAKYPGKFYSVDKLSRYDRAIHLNQFLNTDQCYIFELTTPYNIVVKPHSTSSVTLLAIRNVKTLNELSFEDVVSTSIEIDVHVVKSFELDGGTNMDAILETLEAMPFSEEGYVVVDNNFNRIKIKNPSYLAAHHLKNRTSEHAIMEIIKSNEIEEFGSTFTERREEINKLYVNYHNLRIKLETIWDSLQRFLPQDDSKESIKIYAMEVLRITKDLNESMHSGCFFGLKDKKIQSVNEYLITLDNKKLYTIL